MVAIGTRKSKGVFAAVLRMRVVCYFVQRFLIIGQLISY